jgi:hypothetical protein
MSKSKTILSRCRTVWKTFFNKAESPREIQERNDLYKIALALTFNDLRHTSTSANTSLNKAKSDDLSSSESTSTSAINYIQKREELEIIFDKASDTLEKKEIYDLSIRGLRKEVQQLLRPQVTTLLTTCQKSLESIPSITNLGTESEEYDLLNESIPKRCRDVLYEEQCHTLDLLDTYHSDSAAAASSNNDKEEEQHQAEKIKKQIPFLNKKLSAIQTLASFYQWEHFYFAENNSNSIKGDNDVESKNSNGADEFGYIQSRDDQVNSSIRYYQMVNLSRSAQIRQQLGYSIIALKSTLSNAGRGIFVDGKAPAGSIIAFFPGEVWPKEHLLNSNTLAPYFKKDPRHHLSIRYDDILIDCRKSPYTVLDDKNSNAFAVAHIANHPSKGNEPNCSTIAIDFIENMKLKKLKLDTLVPNTYKRRPMIIGPQAMDLESINMHSMGLLASRDVQNEELFYDYRLSSGSEKSFPEWYHIYNEEELKNRWHRTPM